jgi:hypothetical protein
MLHRFRILTALTALYFSSSLTHLLREVKDSADTGVGHRAMDRKLLVEDSIAHTAHHGRGIAADGVALLVEVLEVIVVFEDGQLACKIERLGGAQQTALHTQPHEHTVCLDLCLEGPQMHGKRHSSTRMP